jgi:alkanesulfonate monooxygenase SsuD/methylene tetrahydromethanopterin reductase-like flavin-dependent oxidoreductase (luciferase family)
MTIELGVFVVPDAADGARLLEQVRLADELGLDVIGVQDHPYQQQFLDTWTLLAVLAARTSRVRLVPDVANLPLRPPAMLAKAAASLDVLSGGRVELGLGTGAFWDGIAAMGGPRRTPKESVDALEEAITVLRAFWRGDDPMRVDGEHYRVHGLRPGPTPAHPIGIWLGAYGPRMLRVAGRLADGWLPSLGFGRLTEDELAARHEEIDAAARAAGRAPEDIRRALNVTLEPDRSTWLDTLLRLARKRFQTFIAFAEGDPIEVVRALAELAPRLRDQAGKMGVS